MTNTIPRPKVLVVIPTFNGEKYLENQIKSILSQKEVDLRIFSRDDASSDQTSDILNAYATYNFQIMFGRENIGTLESLKELVAGVEEGEFIAFADQDDYWEDNHLIEGIRKLKSLPESDFNLYFPKYIFIDKKGNRIGYRKSRTKIGFQNALVENPAIGCGIILNPAAAQKCKRFDFISTIQMDKQLYFLASTLGNVVQGDESSVYYRLHSNNQIGLGRKTRRMSFSRLTSQLKSDQIALESLFERISDSLTSERATLLRRHFKAIKSNLLRRSLYSISPIFRREKMQDQLLFQILSFLGFLK